MKRIVLLIAAIGVALAAVLLSTCDGDTPNDAPVVPPTPTETPKPAFRNRTEAPADDPVTPPEESPLEPADSERTPGKTTTTVFPEGAKVAQPQHTLHGRVIDANGKPVADATVTLVSCWLPRPLVDDRVEILPAQCRLEVLYPHMESTVRTGSTGEFALAYREGGGRRLYAEHAGRVVAFIDGPTDAQTWELRIAEPSPSLEVRVVRASDGTPVAGAFVRLHQLWLDVYWPHAWASLPDPPGAAATTGIDGVCRFDGRIAGMATIHVTAPGFASALGERVEIRASGTSTSEISLSDGYTLTGRVIDAESGSPVPGAEVRTDPEHVRDETIAKTDGEGRFRIEHVAAAQARSFSAVEARAAGFATEKLNAGYVDEASRTCELTIALHRTAGLRVRCVDARGEPVADAIVAASSGYVVALKFGDEQTPRCLISDEFSADSGADGRAAIGGLHPGGVGVELRVRFYFEGVLVLERSFDPLRAGETRDLGDVVVTAAPSLRGTVLDADGKPAAGATVVAALNDPEDANHTAIGMAVISQSGRRAETGTDGAFTLMGLSAGLWDLHATSSITAPGRLQLGVDPRVGTVTIRLPRLVALEGRVVDAKGTPVAGAAVTAAHEEFGIRMMVQFVTPADGRFRIDGFAADAPEVEVSVTPAKGEPAQTFRVRPGEPTTELRLR